jgi:hypothetical protein
MVEMGPMVKLIGSGGGNALNGGNIILFNSQSTVAAGDNGILYSENVVVPA